MEAPWSVRPWVPADASVCAARGAERGSERPEAPPRSAEPEHIGDLGDPGDLERLPADALCGSVACGEDGQAAAWIVARRERVVLGGDVVPWLRVVEIGNTRRGEALGLARPLVRALEAFGKTYGGRAPEGHVIAYGWPTRRLRRLTYAMTRGGVVRNQNRLVLRPETARGEAAHGVQVDEVERFPDELDELFARVRERDGVLRVRDAEAMNARFVGTRHRRLVARAANGALVGCAVHRAGRYHGEPTRLVVDWMEAPAVSPEEAAGPALREALLDAMRTAGDPSLTMLLADSSPHWRAFQDAGYRVFGTNDYVMVASFQRPYDAYWLERHWQYTASDFEG